jgi:hypothetical protein
MIIIFIFIVILFIIVIIIVIVIIISQALATSLIVRRTIHAFLHPGAVHEFSFVFAVAIAGIVQGIVLNVVQAGILASAAPLGGRAFVALAALTVRRVLRVAADVFPFLVGLVYLGAVDFAPLIIRTAVRAEVHAGITRLAVVLLPCQEVGAFSRNGPHTGNPCEEFSHGVDSLWNFRERCGCLHRASQVFAGFRGSFPGAARKIAVLRFSADAARIGRCVGGSRGVFSVGLRGTCRACRRRGL